MSVIKKIASEIGGAIGAFEKARSSGAIRPRFLTSWAQSEKWKGGDFGEREFAEQRAIHNSWVFQAIQYKANEISAGRLQVVITKGEEKPQQIPNHPFEKIMRRPNPFIGRAFLWRFTHWWMDLDGNAYWFISPDGLGQPVEIWPIPSNCMRVVPGDKDRFIDYYEYQANGQIFPIPSEYICHFSYPNPFDIYRGLSPLTAAMLAADSDSAMATWNGNFFGKDNVMPSAVVNMSSGNPNRPIDPADVEALQEKLKSEYSALARKTLVANAYDMDVALLGWSPKEMDFLAGRQFSKEEIFGIYGLPGGLLDKNANEANSTTADQIFKEKTIWPTMVLYAEQITAQVIIPFYGEDREAVFEDIRPKNRKLLMEEFDRGSRVLTLDELRERYFDADPLGDERGQKLLAEIKADPTSLGLENLFQIAGNSKKSIQSKPEADPSEDLRKWKTKALKFLKSEKSLDFDFESDLINEELRNFIHAGLEAAETSADVKAVFDEWKSERTWRPWSNFETRLIEIIENVFHTVIDTFSSKVTEQGSGVFDDPETWLDYQSTLRIALEPQLLEIAKESVRRVAASTSIELDWDLVNERAIQQARDHAGRLVQQISDTTKVQIGEMVSEWSENAETLDELINRIYRLTDEDGLGIFSHSRAERIAITEATSTFASANAASWEQAGYAPVAFMPAAHVRCRCYLQPYIHEGAKVIVWFTARDERVCTRNIQTPWGVVEGCRDLHKVIVSQGQYLGVKING